MTCCNAEPLPIFAFRNFDGGVEVAETVQVGGSEYIIFPNPLDETPWTGVPGDGIDIVPGGPDGHSPTISVCLDPLSPLTFVNGCLSIIETPSPNWTSPNGANPIGGIRVIPGGTQGHNPTFGISIGPGQPLAVVGGQLVFTGNLSGFTCSDLATCSISALGDVSFPNGCQPGDTLMFSNGVWSCGPPTTACDDILALPVLPANVNAQWEVVVGDDGNCYRRPAT